MFGIRYPSPTGPEGRVSVQGLHGVVTGENLTRSICVIHLGGELGLRNGDITAISVPQPSGTPSRLVKRVSEELNRDRLT